MTHSGVLVLKSGFARQGEGEGECMKGKGGEGGEDGERN